ncbi:MAG: trypsin-like peptidase domain-containing protein [Nocardiopsaceae bacterium]|nr:trypsin-like peptidase domain-containing protein [Nocardiopsaceae bacterium]
MSDHRTRWPLWAGIALVVVVVGVGSGLAGAAVGSSGSGSSPPAATTAAAGGCAVTPVADRVLPSVVTIAVQGPNGSGTGSGEIIRSGGYILTNNHVIAPAASGGSIEVKFSDGSTSKASLTGRDPQTDLAVLKVQSAGDLKPIALGSSGSVRVGQPVIALGAPLGLSGTVTSGIVSALDRTVQVPGENDNSALLVSAVQTDAAINPGNSGGALVNCESQLVGVPTAGASVPSSSGESSGGNIGLGFAIPVNLAKTISDELISSGRVTHAYFGVQTVPVSAAAAQQSGTPEGLYVGGVTAGGPAAGAGLRAGDVITKVDGEDATSNVQLQELTLTKKPGDKVPLTYRRGGSTHTADVTLGTQP